MKFLVIVGLLHIFLIIASVSSEANETDWATNSSWIAIEPKPWRDELDPPISSSGQLPEDIINDTFQEDDREESICSFESRGSGDSGEVKSPYFPNNYPNNITCIWTIDASKGRHTYLIFHHFDLEEGVTSSMLGPFAPPECQFDMLYIAEEYHELMSDERPDRNDGGSDKSKYRVRRETWGVFCGKALPPSRMTKIPGSKLILLFRSDESKTKSGFRATFHSIKPKRISHEIKKQERSETPTVSNFLNPSYWEIGDEEAARAFMAIISFITSVFLVIAIIHCWNGHRDYFSRSPFCEFLSRCYPRARNAASLPSVMMNIFGVTSRDSIRTPTPPPAYGDIVKTEEDWQQALQRMGETNESMERYRSHPDNIQVTYDIVGPPADGTADAQPFPRSMSIPRHLPVVQMHDPRGAVTDNFLTDLSRARQQQQQQQPLDLTTNRNQSPDDDEPEVPISIIGRNNFQYEL